MKPMGGPRGKTLDKASSVSSSSMKMKTHVNKTSNSDATLSMTKSHPLHTGKKTTNSYSAYKAN